ncbi:MAG TPA: sugar transferase [Bryobacteraceae bacterium]|nr:sugar transferase [Bryobacteraceae bacterium]
MVFLAPRILTLFGGEALLIAASYVAAAYWSAGADATPFLAYNGGWQQIAVATGLLLGAMYFRNLYGDLRIRSRILLLQELVLVIGVLFIVEALISYLRLGWTLRRGVLLPGSALALASVYVWRILFSAAIQARIGFRRVMFLGFPPTAAALAKYLRQHPQAGFAAIGYMDSRVALGAELERIGEPRELRGATETYRPDWIVIGDRGRMAARQVGDLVALRFGGVMVEDVDAFSERIRGRVCATELRPSQLVFSEAFQPARFNVTLQSMYSTLLALVALPVALPLIAIAAAGIRLAARRPALLAEVCLGLGGIRFKAWRFRTRAGNSGGFLRRSGFDRLPQIFNVLRGDMSLVGPRPDRVEFGERLEEAIPAHAQRLAVRPGIVGWAELQQRMEGSEHDAWKRLEYDLYYVKHLSAILDVFVLLRWIRESLLAATPGGGS